MRLLSVASLLLLLGGCVSSGSQLPGTSRNEAFTAAALVITPAARSDLDSGTVVANYSPGELSHREGPQKALTIDVGSSVTARVKTRKDDSVSLSIECTENRYLMPVPPLGGLRDVAWEGFLRREVVERLRWNRLRVNWPADSAQWREQVLSGFQERLKGGAHEDAIEVEMLPVAEWPSIELVQTRPDARALAYVGVPPEAGGLGWMLLAGPPRIGGDDTLEVVAARLVAAGGQRLPLAELPSQR